MSCENCGYTLKPNARFCGKCGASINITQTDNGQNQTNYAPPPPKPAEVTPPPPPPQTNYAPPQTNYAPPPQTNYAPPPQTNYAPPPQTNSQVTGKEKVYYRGEGQLLVRTTKHHGAGRKAAAFLATGGVGYAIAGRDSKRTTKAKGSIVVTNKAIYCAGNKFDFDQILAMTVKGTLQKKIHLTLSKDVEAGGRGQGLGGSSRISIEIEISTRDINGLFKGLENARMADVEF